MQRKRKKGRRASVTGLLISAVLVVLIGMVMIFFYLRYGASSKKMDAGSYFGNESGNDIALIVNGKKLEQKGRLINQKPYIDYTTVFQSINSGLYFETKSKTLYLTLQSGSHTYTANDGSGAFLLDGETPYVSFDFLKENTDMESRFLENPNRLVIRTVFANVKQAAAQKETAVRRKGGPKSEILTTLKPGEKVTLGEAFENWTQVTTEDGYAGYVKNTDIDVTGQLSHETDPKFTFKRISLDQKIVLGWQSMESAAGNANLDALTQYAAGLNVISPTWFKIQDENGALRSFADKAYVDAAHAKGLKVWGLLGAFSSDKIPIGTVLADSAKREHIIRQLLDISAQTGMDGINIDIESIKAADAPQYLQFLRELSVGMHEKGLVLSVDNYVPTFTKHLNRREQAKFVDYLIIMGYDEHTNGSEEAGSVASLPFVEKGITDTLEEVPASQVINAVPFYTRGWTESYGKDVPASEALGMDQADQWAAKYGIKTAYDQSVGENTGSAEGPEARYSIWLEDETALKNKMELIEKYKLAGVAAWRLGFERPTVWQIIQSYMQ